MCKGKECDFFDESVNGCEREGENKICENIGSDPVETEDEE